MLKPGWKIVAISAVLAWPSGTVAEEAPSPYYLEAVYTGEVWRNMRGGLRKGTVYLDNIDVMLGLNMDHFGWEGARFFFYGLTNNSSTFSDRFVDDLQVISNIDNDRIFRLFEAWYEQAIPALGLSLKFGLFDLNSEFDAIDTAGLFINSSHGIGPDFSQTGGNGPSIFPNTSLALRAEFTVIDTVTIRSVVLDAVPQNPDRPKRNAIKVSNNEGALLVGEVDIKPSDRLRLGAGYWHYTAKFDTIDSSPGFSSIPRRRGNNGVYFYIEGQLTAEKNDADQGLSGHIRTGFADGGINQLSHYFGTSLVYTGPFPGRDEDQLGLGLARAKNGRRFRAVQMSSGSPVERYETNLELTYRLQLNNFIAFQPNMQVILNPGTDPNLRNALVIGLRFEIGAGTGEF